MTENSESGLATTTLQRTPFGLKVLAILSGLGSLSGLVMAVGLMIGGKAFALACNVPLLDAMLRDDSNGGIAYLLLKTVLFLASATGLAFLWKMRKLGFWIYLGAQILLLLSPFLLMNSLEVDYLLVKLFINTVFTILFILLYSYYYKLLN
jgi:hypothetical protein